MELRWLPVSGGRVLSGLEPGETARLLEYRTDCEGRHWALVVVGEDEE